MSTTASSRHETGAARQEAVAILALLLTPGVGVASVGQVIVAARYLGKPVDALFRMGVSRLADALPPGLHEAARTVARCPRPCRVHAATLMARVERSGVYALTWNDGDYPHALRRMTGNAALPLLFVAGNATLLQEECVAVVGARNPSGEGLRLANECAETVGQANITVVSGGAFGVDSAAHDGALANGGRTIVVLPQGILTYRAPLSFRKAIAEGRAAFVSQFAPMDPWGTYRAVTRNVTISGLVRLVCVIEPKKTGGSVRTARYAIASGKRVLIHCGQGLPDLARQLTRVGALDLLDGAGRFDAERLLDLWQTAPRISSPKPLDLFPD